MLNINFVPDDYIQSNESRRTNLMYFILFAVVMAGLGGAFMTIKVRQHAIEAKERLVNEKLTKAKEAIKKFEELQEKRKSMMKTALTTAELHEPVPRSVLIASLTNNLPPGVSLLKLTLVQKEIRDTSRRPKPSTTKFEQAKKTQAASEMPPKKQIETVISLEGIAPSDLQVAAYIENLSGSALLNNVALVESKEKEIEEAIFRDFKLTAKLADDVFLTKDDIKRIKSKCEKSMSVF